MSHCSRREFAKSAAAGLGGPLAARCCGDALDDGVGLLLATIRESLEKHWTDYAWRSTPSSP